MEACSLELEGGLRWYVLRTKPRKETVVERRIGDLGLEVFLPWLRLRRRIGTNTNEINKVTLKRMRFFACAQNDALFVMLNPSTVTLSKAKSLRTSSVKHPVVGKVEPLTLDRR